MRFAPSPTLSLSLYSYGVTRRRDKSSTRLRQAYGAARVVKPESNLGYCLVVWWGFYVWKCGQAQSNQIKANQICSKHFFGRGWGGHGVEGWHDRGTENGSF